MKKRILLITILFISIVKLTDCTSRFKYSEKQGSSYQTIQEDIREIKLIRKQITNIIQYVEDTPEIFQKNIDSNKILSRNDRFEIWQTWQLFLDQIIRLDSIGSSYDLLYKEVEGKLKAQAFNISFASFLTQYHYSMDFINTIDRNPTLHKIINEGAPELNLEKDSYAKLKLRFLHLARASEFIRLRIAYRYYKRKDTTLKKEISKDSKWLYKAGMYQGPKDTLKNGLKIIQDSSITAWYPVKKRILLVGKAKVWRPGKYLITDQQIEELNKKLEPGDILLERREWHLSNIGLPGYWPHAAFYIGTKKQREEYFNDPEVISWVKEKGQKDGKFESLLQKKYKSKYKEAEGNYSDNQKIQVIESISPGVIFTSLHYSAQADSVAALRPNTDKLTKAKAIYDAMHFVGRPYDFDFNFETDNKLVCSELIYKAFENKNKNFDLPITSILGKKVLPPNLMAETFSKEYNKPHRTFDFISFIDGNEYAGKSSFSDLKTFKDSWKRPKWHAVVKH